jgi:hypothetical protein
MPIDLDIDRLKNRTAQLSDDELLKIAFTNAHEHQPIAIQIAREELGKRGIEVEVVATDPTGARLLPPEPEYKGVRGWLLLLCLGLTVFSPLFTMESLVKEYVEWSEYFDRFPGVQVITVTKMLLIIGLMAFSIYAGVRLWSVRPGAVQVAKRYFFCALGYHAVAAILPFMAGLPSAATDAMIPHVVQDVYVGVITFAVWYLYLDNSKRVKATFGL